MIPNGHMCILFDYLLRVPPTGTILSSSFSSFTRIGAAIAGDPPGHTNVPPGGSEVNPLFSDIDRKLRLPLHRLAWQLWARLRLLVVKATTVLECLWESGYSSILSTVSTSADLPADASRPPQIDSHVCPASGAPTAARPSRDRQSSPASHSRDWQRRNGLELALVARRLAGLRRIVDLLQRCLDSALKTTQRWSVQTQLYAIR
ncbi:unnamed protein product [Protopolystoma xenopodis]|uniref:Uncharacterized protein n=1 Tax=Protopolystoma xenopodis TaxID=117903 RepID=A0A3S5CU45_9PLAT|nr:unnamed protein product [Protopolystoma xenopodis]